ncbi:MAG: bifunctional YncE family protein/alkaline phosphatase family protein [Bradymonadia bacterium]
MSGRNSAGLCALVVGLAGCGDGDSKRSAEVVDARRAVDAAPARDTMRPTPREDARAPGPDAASVPPADAQAPPEGDAGLYPEGYVFDPACVPRPSAEAQRPMGKGPDGLNLALGGRVIAPAGPTVVLPGFPARLVVHPDRPLAFVSSTSDDDRRLLVVDTTGPSIVQDLDRGEGFSGLALDPTGARLYAAGGVAGRVDAYTLDADGRAMPAGSAETGGYPAAVTLSADSTTLWVGLFDEGTVVEFDAATLEERRRIRLPTPVWDLLLLPERNELWAADLGGDAITIVDLVAGAPVELVRVPTAPARMVKSPAGDRVYAAVSGADMVVRIDAATREVVTWAPAADPAQADDDGVSLPNSNPNGLALVGDRLYVSLGANNAVSVLNADTLDFLGALPSAWYPTDVAASADGTKLVVIDGRGGGAGPNEGKGAKERLAGSLSVVDLPTLDLAASTVAARAHYTRPRDVFPFECEGDFPVPLRRGRPTPIEHVVLVVKENKTFDCIFAGLKGELDVTADPRLLRWGEDLTPNSHALARAFSLSDNFYTESANSDAGHIFLTSAHLTEYAERVWIEANRSGRFTGYQLNQASIPDVGNFFVHLIDNDVSVRVYGEIVGMLAESRLGRGRVIERSDRDFPGGPFTNYSVKDEDKARYVVSKIEAGELAQFTFLLLPNDHTNGTRPGDPTPESMVADNDFALGLVVEALSKSPFWPKTAIFVLEDDPQGCEDHVDAHRSFLLVVSPWARRAHVSHVHASYVSVFATMTRLLGVPPIGRPDAAASPVWDMFTATPDLTPYAVVPRRLPEEVNPPDAPGAMESMRMDFRSPDRSPELAPLLDAYRLWKMGRISRAEAERRIRVNQVDPERWEDLDEESEEETFAFDRDWARYQAWRAERGLPPDRLPERAGPQR